MTCGTAQGPGGACAPALNFGQLESLWTQAGGNPAMAPLMAGIALAESGGVPNNNNYTDNNGTQTSWGLWQLSDGTHNEYAQGIGTNAAANAAAAVAKFKSQGVNAWQGDAVWQAWHASGAQQWPSAATVQGWLAGRGLSTGGGAAAPISGSSGTGTSQGGEGTLGCTASGDVFGEGGFLGIGSFHFTHCEAKALVSAMILASGVVIMGLGTVVVVTWGLVGTKAGQAVTGAAGAVPGPLGRAADVAKRVGRAPRAARDRRNDRRLESDAEEADLENFGTTNPTRAQRTAADRDFARSNRRVVEGVAPRRRRRSFTPTAGDA